MLLTRILTAVVLLAGFFAALFLLDRAYFGALVAVVVALAAHEWGRLAGLKQVPALAFAAVCLLVLVMLRVAGIADNAIWIALPFWIVVAPWWLATRPAGGSRGLLLAAGIVVIIPAGLAMAELAPRYLLMALGLVWVADSAAYFTGRAFGKRKLAPAISPGKTWEGVAGGAVGCIIYAIIWACFDPELQPRVQGAVWMPFLAGTLLLCALSVVGDLLESAVKRRAGAKDSGRLLPGHGGVLDRIDSATATLPVALLLLRALEAA